MALSSFSKRICTDILSSHSLNPYSPLCNTICRSISRQPRYLKEVGLPDFLKAVGNGVEAHSEKLANEVGDLQKLLETRTMTLKKLGIPCKHGHRHLVSLQNCSKGQERDILGGERKTRSVPVRMSYREN